MTRNPLLYDLLPDYIRFRDQESGRALEALMGVLDLEYQRLHVGTQRLYDDWFIETCEPWLVPFIGDLVGLDRLERAPKARFSWRPLVAKAVARRRYKGTVACLERTARDATGWSAFARWQAESVGWTQDLRAPKTSFGGFLDLRDAYALERIETPFDAASHTVDLREEPRPGFDGHEGRLSHPDWVSLWLWRVESRPIWRGAPRRVGEGCYTFDPFGQDVPLFIQPRASSDERRPTREMELPLPLRTSTLERLLDELRRSEVMGQVGRTPVRRWLQLFDASRQQPIPLRSIAAWDLGDWRRPGPEDRFCLRDERLGYEVEHPVLAAVDPELGRLTLAPRLEEQGEGQGGEEPHRILVSYSYGSACDVGGGPDLRTRREVEPGVWRALVLSDGEGPSPDFVGPPVFGSLEDALAAWPAEEPRAHLRIVGSGRLDAQGEKARWHLALEERRELVIEAAEGSRPFLSGEMVVCGRAFEEVEHDGRQSILRLAGLWLDGAIELQGAIELDVESSTLGPPLLEARGRAGGAGAVTREHGVLRASGPLLAFLSLRSSILGPLRLPPSGVACEILDCVLDGALWRSGVAYAGSRAPEIGPALVVERTTVLGELRAESISATDVYFSRRPQIARSGIGRLSHCFRPPGDQTEDFGLPPEDHVLPPASPEPCCQAPGWEAARQNENWLVSIVYGDSGYAQIASTAPRQLMTGGTEGSSVGVTHRLYEAERFDRLPAVFQSALRCGMQARTVLVDGSGVVGPRGREKSRRAKKPRAERRTTS